MPESGRREARFEAVWYGQSPAPLGWRLASVIYRLASGVRRWSYRSGLRTRCNTGVATIVVGNVTVGGTGKTPLVIWLVQQLRQAGRTPGVISRGYGGNADRALLVQADTPASRCGDEALMMTRRGCAVAVCPDRALAARLLINSGCDIIIADDGLQHYRLARDVEIAVIDGLRGLGNGKLLPAGPLREPAARLRKVDFVVVNGGDKEFGVPMRLVGTQLVNSLTGASEPLADWQGRTVHAVAGIGNPERFYLALEQAGLELARHSFSDHHPYSGDELLFGDEHAIVTTEKDLMRMGAMQNTWYLPVDAELPEEFSSQILKLVNAAR